MMSSSQLSIDGARDSGFMPRFSGRRASQASEFANAASQVAFRTGSLCASLLVAANMNVIGTMYSAAFPPCRWPHL